MQVISEGFRVMYEILQVGSIKPGTSGTYQGTPYAASVKFRSVLSYQTENKEVGIQEQEQILEFSIRCSSESEAIVVAEHIRKARSTKTPFYINAPIAQKREGADIFKVVSLDTGAEFIKSITKSK